MNIAVSAPFRMHGGGLVHLRNILQAWHGSGAAAKHSITLYLRPESVPALSLPSGHRFRIEDAGDHAMGTLDRLLWEQTILPGKLKRAGANVVFCPGNLVPLRSEVPTVAVFHNAAPFHRGMRLRDLGLHDWAFFQAMGPLMRFSARAARRAVFISNYFKDLFVKRFGFPSERGDVIYHGRDALAQAGVDERLLASLGIRRPYCLSVSHLYPYKNFPALIQGFAEARVRASGLQLVLAGKPNQPAYLQHLRQLVIRHGLEEHVHFTGPVPHRQVGPLMAGCEFFLFQSTCENCPVSLIEALAAGLPIASSNSGVMPEIAGSGACYFDSNDPVSIAGQIRNLATNRDLRAELRDRALRQSKQFPTWEEAGRLTLQTLERAALAAA